MGTINDRIAEIIKQSGLTKTAFAERLKVTPQYVSKLTLRGEPSDRTIGDICREFEINEEWLRYGEGEMHKKMSREQEIAGFIGEILGDREKDFQRRFVHALARLDYDQWLMLEKVVDKLTEELNQK